MAEHEGQVESIETNWRELYRCDDRERAISVTTSIASMGFDVECGDSGGNRTTCKEGGCGGEGPALGDPPYVIRVPAEHVTELGPVLKEIIAEQEEFDLMLAQRELQGRRLRQRFVLVALIVVVLVLGLLGLLRM